MTSLHELAKERIIILDGAIGTRLQRYRLTENDYRNDDTAHIDCLMNGNYDILNITRPDIITDIHRKYIEAGADIITTNTFNAQRISQADYHTERFVRDMNLAGARLARKVADEYATPEKPRLVAGSVGPTNKTCSMSPDVSNPALRELDYDELFDAYTEQIDALIEGGADLLLIETIFDTLNAKIAIDAASQSMSCHGKKLPLMVSATISDLAGRTLSGQTIDAFITSISHAEIFSVGLNCSFGARQMKPYIEQMGRTAPYYISAYPNAGMPDSMGHYDETAESMAPQIAEFIDEGLVNILGGCCGTDETFIRRYAEMAVGKKPHAVTPRPATLRLSGLEMLDVTPEVRFVNVGERCNVAGSRKFLRLISGKQYDEALSIARKQVDDGALVIDINMDDGLLDARAEMVNFINLIGSDPEISRVPIMIDSSKWDVIVAGLKVMQGKGIVNSISLKEGESVFLSHARDIKRFGAAVVVMLFDEKGQATTYERKIEIASRAYRLLTEKAGLHPLDIIFDPNVLAVATGMEEHDSYAVDFIRATGWIRTHLKGTHVSGGLSNLSFAFRGNNFIREAMHAVFLYHAVHEGMDFGILNPSSSVIYSDIPKDTLQVIEDVILNRKSNDGGMSPAERLIEIAKSPDSDDKKMTSGSESMNTKKNAEDVWRNEAVAERLNYALTKGIADFLEQDIHEALKQYDHAVDIIEGPLMDAMKHVGELFGSGKMFLPQVVKTARTMKKSVAILQPYIESERQGGSAKAGKVLLATVKGDVHDIGKNIVGVIMACNNYEIIDMGVMVPAEQIVRKAIEEQVDIIGLSGLITPSLEEMVHVAHELEKAGLNIPIMIGGATTSQLHVALKIAPVYGGPVVWIKDASQNALVASKLLSPEQRRKYVESLNHRYDELRRDYTGKASHLLDIGKARDNGLKLFN
jgi:5-methyltetrahydrofolate--homocysteine methyltransferase